MRWTKKVDLLRASISAFENGQYVTYPFDIEASRGLYNDLMAPVSERLAAKSHLIFEPDGAMLRLPINLLVVDDASVADYLARVEQPDGDPFDYTGVRWLGIDTNISTAVSARGFADARRRPFQKLRGNISAWAAISLWRLILVSAAYGQRPAALMRSAIGH